MPCLTYHTCLQLADVMNDMDWLCTRVCDGVAAVQCIDICQQKEPVSPHGCSYLQIMEE